MEIPSAWNKGKASWFTKGWRVNGIYRYVSGDALTVVPGTDTVLRGADTQRVDIRGNPVLRSNRSFNEQLNRYWNVSAFVLGAPGAFGIEGRNALYGPGQHNLDLSVFRIFNISESKKIEFRWEMFNALNHPNPGDPVTILTASNFGKINTATAPRRMQGGIKIRF